MRFLALFVIFVLCFAILRIGIRPKLRATPDDANIENPGTDHHPPPSGPRKKLRPGPKPLPLEARSFRQRVGPIKKICRTYSRSRKVQVILFLMHHRVPISVRVENTQFRQPTHREAWIYRKIPETTIQQWWTARHTIAAQGGTSGRQKSLRLMCLWPEMEKELIDTFLDERQKGKLVRRGWFRNKARQPFVKHYGPGVTANMFVFSVGWFNGFMKRWRISCGVLTKISSRVPDEYQRLVINWLRFNRRNSQPRNFYERACLTTDVGWYRLSNILNLDETPIPFEYLDGKTYAIKGSITVSGKTDRSGWDKRQATLILYIFVDGVSRIKPKIIFHASSRNNIRRKEAHLWNTEVSVELNSTAYNNEKLFLVFIDDDLFSCPE